MHKIGFIGLGNMGAPLCERLLLKNKVNIFDINKSNLNKMENLGGIVKYELKDMCENDFIFLCLPTSEIVEKITISENGLINNLKKNVLNKDELEQISSKINNLYITLDNNKEFINNITDEYDRLTEAYQNEITKKTFWGILNNFLNK